MLTARGQDVNGGGGKGGTNGGRGANGGGGIPRVGGMNGGGGENGGMKLAGCVGRGHCPAHPWVPFEG